MLGRYHDGHVKCASADGNGYTDYFYLTEDTVNTQDCHGYFQMTYTSDGGSTNTSHEPVDYLTDFMGSLSTMTNGAITVSGTGYCG